MPVRAQLGVAREELVALVAECGYREAGRRLGVAMSTVHKRINDIGARDEVAELAQQWRRAPQVSTTTESARRALTGASGVYREALQARIDHPHNSMQEVAAMLGWKPNTYATRLRRALTGATPQRSTLGRARSEVTG